MTQTQLTLHFALPSCLLSRETKVQIRKETEYQVVSITFYRSSTISPP